MTNHSLNTQNISNVFLAEDYSLDMITLKQHQAQDPVLKTVYYGIT